MKVGWENRRLGILVFVCALVLIGFTVCADTPQTQPSNPFTLAPDLASEAGDLPGNPDSINADLEEAASRPAGLLKHGPVSLLDPLIKKFNQTTEDFGLNVGISYTIVYQIASGYPGDRDAAGGDFDLFGSWRLLGQEG